MAEVIVLEDQSLFDVAVQVCGSVESVFTLAWLNGISITDRLVPGASLTIPNIAYNVNLIAQGVIKPVAEYYSRNLLKPATDRSMDDTTEHPGSADDGIDYMAVEVDNIVS